MLIAGVLLAVGACGPAGRDDWPLGRPRIDLLRYESQAPQRPNALAFELYYTDSDGDLDGGRLRVFQEDREHSSLPMADVFANQAQPVTAGTTAGDFEVYVTLEGQLASGSEIEIGFLLEDATGRPVQLSAHAPTRVDFGQVRLPLPPPRRWRC